MVTSRYLSKKEMIERLKDSIPAYSHNKSIYDACVHTLIEYYHRNLIEPSAREAELRCLYRIFYNESTIEYISTPLKCRADQGLLGEDQFFDDLFGKWIFKYIDAWKQMPSEKPAPQKEVYADKALMYIVEAVASKEDAIAWAEHHYLFMSAENVNGALLEEYIASKVLEFGWIWCRGSILTSIDFCNDRCTHFLQIKNRTNTENSSSRGYRQERDVQAWQRICKVGDNQYGTDWLSLVEIVRKGATRDSENIPDDLLTEDDYLEFVRRTVSRNQHIIGRIGMKCPDVHQGSSLLDIDHL